MSALAEFAPRGVDLTRYAAVRARLAEGDRALSAILSELDLAPADFAVADAMWQRAFVEELLEGGSEVAEAFEQAFVAAQDALRPLVELSPEEWARIVVALGRGGAPAALDGRGLRPADLARLQRHWTKQIAAGGPTADRYFAEFYRLSRVSVGAAVGSA